jgi:hypothetical protein
MATETITQITQPPEFIEAEAKQYLGELRPAIAGLKAADLSQIYGPQYVAGLGGLTEEAISKAGGLGAYAPYLQQAGRLAGAAETTLGGIPTDIAAARGTLTGVPADIAAARGTLTGVPADIAAARGALGTAAGDIAAARGMIGPTAYQQYMSPYQQDVIESTLAEYDIQAAKGLPGLAAQAIGAGAFGGAREGVQRAEYMSASDRNRAALQAQLLQQGFGQAQQLAQQAQAQRMGVAGAQAGLAGQQLGLGQAAGALAGQQLGLGQAAGALAGQQLGVGQAQLGAQMGLAGQQLGLGQFQAGLAGQAPGLAGQEISALTTLGGLQQAQQQAQLQAQQQLAQQQMMQPLQAAQAYGSGVMGLISGYPAQQQVGQVPVPGIAQTAIGAGTTLAGIYGALGGFNR